MVNEIIKPQVTVIPQSNPFSFVGWDFKTFLKGEENDIVTAIKTLAGAIAAMIITLPLFVKGPVWIAVGSIVALIITLGVKGLCSIFHYWLNK